MVNISKNMDCKRSSSNNPIILEIDEENHNPENVALLVL
jgi:hypothetical protein